MSIVWLPQTTGVSEKEINILHIKPNINKLSHFPSQIKIDLINFIGALLSGQISNYLHYSLCKEFPPPPGNLPNLKQANRQTANLMSTSSVEENCQALEWFGL